MCFNVQCKGPIRFCPSAEKMKSLNLDLLTEGDKILKGFLVKKDRLELKLSLPFLTLMKVKANAPGGCYDTIENLYIHCIYFSLIA